MKLYYAHPYNLPHEFIDMDGKRTYRWDEKGYVMAYRKKTFLEPAQYVIRKSAYVRACKRCVAPRFFIRTPDGDKETYLYKVTDTEMYYIGE